MEAANRKKQEIHLSVTLKGHTTSGPWWKKSIWLADQQANQSVRRKMEVTHLITFTL